MKVSELRRMVAAIPEEFDDLHVVGYVGGYECEAEELSTLEVVEDWYGYVDLDEPRETESGYMLNVRHVSGDERVLVIR